MEPEIRFCTTPDGVRIAYATVGQGPPVLLCSSVYSHVEAEWQLPWRRAWYERLAQKFTVVRYDKRGMGISQRGQFEYCTDVLVMDLEAVIEQLGVERLALAGVALGGAAALLYTIRHPGRVSRLVLYDAVSSGTELSTRAALAPLLSMARSNWPMARVLVNNIGTVAAPEDVRLANERLLEAAIDGETFARVMELAHSLDLGPLLGQVTVPVLVMHERGNRVIPIESGRRLAAALPNARFVALDGDSTTLFRSASSETIVDTIIDFVSEGEAHLDGLTGREVQVLRLIAAGRSNREIGAELVISTNTVDRHVSNILAKTEAANRAEAAASAARRGLVA